MSAHEFVSANEFTIVTALRVYAEHMENAAKNAREQYDAGQIDPEVRAAQDASLMTNAGYRMSAELFAETAQRTRRVLDELNELIESDGEGW